VAELMGEANVLPAGLLKRSGGGNRPVSGLAMIRAESFHLDASEIAGGTVAVTGTLSAKAFRGENWLLNLQTASGNEVTLSVPATRSAGCAEFQPGQSLTAYAAAATVHSLPESAVQ